MEIRKLSNDMYTAKVEEKEIEEIKDMLNTLSNGKLDQYDISNNATIFNLMLSRKVAAEFFDRGLDITNDGFVIVDTNIGNEVIKISLGQIELDKITRVNGVLYK